MSKKAFTTIELIIVLFIIGLLVSAITVVTGKVRRQQRDSRRVSDIGQLQVALAAYRRDVGSYPSSLVAGQNMTGTGTASSTVYMTEIPSPPLPQDSPCSSYPDYSSYVYVPGANNKSYCLFFCLSSNTGDLSAGGNMATPKGIINTDLGEITCAL